MINPIAPQNSRETPPLSASVARGDQRSRCESLFLRRPDGAPVSASSGNLNALERRTPTRVTGSLVIFRVCSMPCFVERVKLGFGFLRLSDRKTPNQTTSIHESDRLRPKIKAHERGGGAASCVYFGGNCSIR